MVFVWYQELTIFKKEDKSIHHLSNQVRSPDICFGGGDAKLRPERGSVPRLVENFGYLGILLDAISWRLGT